MPELTVFLDPVAAGDVVLAALSGGADSVALTHRLRAQAAVGGFTLAACHVNHCLRGEESECDQQFVEALCRDWEVPLTVHRADVRALARQRKQGLEACARDVRYDLLEETAAKLGGTVWIATAHTASDNAETLLFRLARGTGLKGLCGIPKQRGRIIRPLLSWTREEVEAYCREQSLSFVHDSTNQDERIARNCIRGRALPALEQVNSAAQRNISEAAARLVEDSDFLESLAAAAYERCRREAPPGAEVQSALAADLVKQEALPIQKRIAALFLTEHGFAVNAYTIEETLRLVNAGGGRSNLQGSRCIAVKKGLLVVCELSVSDTQSYRIELQEGALASKTGKNYKIKNLEIATSKRIHKVYEKLFAICLDCGKICGSAFLRPRLPGDRIKLAGSPHTKTLKQLFQERGIDVPLRSKLFILADEQGVIAVEGLGEAQRVCCGEETEKIWLLTEEPLEEPIGKHKGETA